MLALSVALQVLSLVPELRIGGDERGPAYTFTDISQVIPARGRLFVTETQLHTIRVFDMQGHFLYMIGRRGGGPGEFEWVQRIGQAVRNPYAARYAAGSNIVVLEPDVAALFPNSTSVNEALRSLAKVMAGRKAKRSTSERTA